MKDKYLTVTEVAEMLRISYDKALNYIKTSGVAYVQVGRQYRVLESKLNEVLYPTMVVKHKLKGSPLRLQKERK